MLDLLCYACPYNDCTLAYNRKDCFQKHYEKHLNLDYQCLIENCNKTFYNYHGLKEHERSQHLILRRRNQKPARTELNKPDDTPHSLSPTTTNDDAGHDNDEEQEKHEVIDERLNMQQTGAEIDDANIETKLKSDEAAIICFNNTFRSDVSMSELAEKKKKLYIIN